MRRPTVLVVRRIFRASPERVFDAWLDPESVRRWLFATPGGAMQRVELDPRVGGEFLIVERRGETEAEHFGTYREIDRPRRLVFTFAAVRDVPPTLVTVEIAPCDEGSGERCELTLTHEMDPQWAKDEDRTREGWTTILAGLAATLPIPAKDGEIHIVRHYDAPREAVWRAWTELERLRRWYAPDGGTTEFSEFDLRPGGRYRACVRTLGQPDCWTSGEYEEIVAPVRLVFTNRLTDPEGRPLSSVEAGKDAAWPAETTISVTFEEEGGGTRLTLRQNASEAAGRRTGAYGSWLQMLNRLSSALPQDDLS